MRRLILEFSIEDLTKFGNEVVPPNLELFEVLHILKQDSKEFAAICRVTPKDPTQSPDLFQGPMDKVQLLERTRNGVCTYFVRSRLTPGSLDSKLLVGSGGFFAQPFELRNGKVTMTFLGDSKQVKKFLRRASEIKIPYRVVSLVDAKFSPTSPLTRLTEKQRRALITAYNLGYYSLPKKASSADIAAKLHIKSSTFVMHRIKAERILIAEAMGGI